MKASPLASRRVVGKVRLASGWPSGSIAAASIPPLAGPHATHETIQTHRALVETVQTRRALDALATSHAAVLGVAPGRRRSKAYIFDGAIAAATAISGSDDPRLEELFASQASFEDFSPTRWQEKQSLWSLNASPDDLWPEGLPLPQQTL